MAVNAEFVDDNQKLLNINMVNVTKLTSTNFMTWSLQIHALLEGYDLAGFLDGSSPAPAQTITVDNVVSTNPDYTKWRRQDRLVYSGLIGTLSPSIQTLVTNTKTSQDVWKSLSATYATPSRGHIQQLRLQLKHFTKGDKTIDDYMRGLTSRFDQLALLGKPLDHEDKIEFIIDGLPEEYKSVSDQLEGRDVSPSIVEIHEKLINKEAKLLAMNTTLPVAAPITANMATSKPRQHNNQQYRGNSSNSNWTGNKNQQYNSSKQDTRQSKGYQGRCQICSTFGHSARRCPQLAQQQNAGYNSSPFRPWQPRANLVVAS